MLRYFFDLQNDPDTVGMVLPDAHSARRTAVRYASDIFRDMSIDARNELYWRMDVRSEDNASLFSLILELVPAPAATRRPFAASRADGTAAPQSSLDWHSV